MSKYTTQVRFICEHNAGLSESKGFNDVDEIITESAPKIFNFDWPIFDENYRLPLEIKILRYFYTQEISEETVALWKLRLQNKLNLIMPYYNQLYESELLEFLPFVDTNYTVDHSGHKSDDGTLTKTGSDITDKTGDDTIDIDNRRDNNLTNTRNGVSSYVDDSHGFNSDTPQGSLQNVLAGTYMSDASVSHSEGHNTDTNITSVDTGYYTDDNRHKTTYNSTITLTHNTTDKNIVTTLDGYIDKVTGKRGTSSYSKMLAEFRDTFLNIDRMIINDLQPLFFGLWE